MEMQASDGPYRTTVTRLFDGRFEYRIERNYGPSEHGVPEEHTLEEGFVTARDFDRAWLLVDAKLARVKKQRPRRLPNGWLQLKKGVRVKHRSNYTLTVRDRVHSPLFDWRMTRHATDGDVTAEGTARTVRLAVKLCEKLLGLTTELLPDFWYDRAR